MSDELPDDVPDVWGEGLIFAFSGIDGPTETAGGFVATLAGRRVDLLLHTPRKRLLHLQLPEPGRVRAATGDVLAVETPHGDLTLTISENPQVSQPHAFSPGGATVVTPQTNLETQEKEARLFVLEPGVSVDTVARALNALGVSPRDLISIFQALKNAGALHAQLVIM